jgi:hypothetical protein
VEKELRETAARRGGGVSSLNNQMAINRELNSQRKDSANYDIILKKFMNQIDKNGQQTKKVSYNQI